MMKKMTFAQFEDMLKDIDPGVPGWKLTAGACLLAFTEGKTSSQFWLRIECPDGRCNVTGDPMPWTGRKWIISRRATISEVVQTALKAVLTAMEHEVRESFKFAGIACFDPHLSVLALRNLRVRNQTDARSSE